MKVKIYELRILISLLSGGWKTAPEIAREWHTRTATAPEKVYRQKCKLMSKSLLKPRFRNLKSKRKDLEYTINLGYVYKKLAQYWNLNPLNIKKLLNKQDFKVYVAKQKKPNTKEIEDFFGLVWSRYIGHILSNKSATKDDKDFVRKLLEDWGKNNIEEIKDVFGLKKHLKSKFYMSKV